MKIDSITIKNVRSFKESITYYPNDIFNVLVGSNGSGKSNLMDIIYITLRHFFLYSYNWQKERGENGIFKNLELVHSPFGAINQLLTKYSGDNSQSEIILELVVTEVDIDNLRTIDSNKDAFKAERAEYNSIHNWIEEFLNEPIVEIKPGEKFKYVIKDLQYETQNDSRAEYYRRYLRVIEGLIILGKGINVFLSPLVLYISPFRGVTNASLEVSLASASYNSERAQVARSTSRSTSSLIRLASLYFSEKRRQFEALPGGYEVNWNKDPDVQFVSRSLERIGYTWDISLEDLNKNTYIIQLKKDGRSFLLNQASSGEVELINFILGLITMNLFGSIVIVDEPELHLHPKWINVLRGFFMEYAFSRKNQLMIVTHSGTFINSSTYQFITRVYKDEYGSSKIHQIKTENQQEEKELLHFINATNNEKIFFSDFVVMVEGDTDEIVFKKILETIKKEKNYVQNVEVMQVRGKTNQEKYGNFLKTLQIRSCFIGDIDNINQLANGDEKIKALLMTNARRVVKHVIKNPGAMDNEQLVNYLEEAIKTGNIEELKELYEYIVSFRTKIRPDITPEEKTLLDQFIDGLYERNIFILKDGEIESYLLDGYKHKDLDNVLKITQGELFERWRKDEGFIKLKTLVELALQRNGVIS